MRLETTVYIEITNNEHCIKFVFNFILLKEGEFKFYHRNSVNLEECNLVIELFEKYPEIEEIFFSSNFLAISFTKYWNYSSSYIEAIRDLIKDVFSKSDQPLLNKEFVGRIKEIQKFLDDYINPVIEMDGGRYQVYNYSLKNNSLILLPLGSCRNSQGGEIDLSEIKRIMRNVCNIELEAIMTINKNN